MRARRWTIHPRPTRRSPRIRGPSRVRKRTQSIEAPIRGRSLHPRLAVLLLEECPSTRRVDPRARRSSGSAGVPARAGQGRPAALGGTRGDSAGRLHRGRRATNSRLAWRRVASRRQSRFAAPRQERWRRRRGDRAHLEAPPLPDEPGDERGSRPASPGSLAAAEASATPAARHTTGVELGEVLQVVEGLRRDPQALSHTAGRSRTAPARRFGTVVNTGARPSAVQNIEVSSAAVRTRTAR